MMPVAGQNAVLHAATIEWKAHMRTPVVQGVHSILVIDDQDRSMRSVHQEPSFFLEFLKSACTKEFRAHNRASSCRSTGSPDCPSRGWKYSAANASIMPLANAAVLEAATGH
jgi:hypothetical protein